MDAAPAPQAPAGPDPPIRVERPANGPQSANGAVSRAKGAKAAAPTYHSEYKPTLDRFDALFRERRGAAPTWDARRRARLNALVAAHGGAEVVRRAGIMFDLGDRGKWPVDGGGDLDTLDRHFDRFADGAALSVRNRNGEKVITGAQAMEWAGRLAEEERHDAQRTGGVVGQGGDPDGWEDGDIGSGHRGVELGSRFR